MTTNRLVCAAPMLLMVMLALAPLPDSLARPQTPLSFANLAPAEAIHVELESTGCFHHTRHALVFKSDPAPHLTVARYLAVPPVGSGQGPSWEAETELLGTIDLTRDHVSRLDNLLRHYRRTDRRDGCTTSDVVTFVKLDHGREARRERYTDSGCEVNELDADPRDLEELGISHPPVLDLSRISWWLETEMEDAGEPVHRHLVDDWGSSSARSSVMMQRRQTQSVVMVREMPCHETMDSRFEIESTDLGYAHLSPDFSFRARLRTREAAALDAAVWSNPVIDERPVFDWCDFMRVWQDIETMVERTTWLASWKEHGEDRTIESEIIGETGFNLRPPENEDVARAWRHAGLAGDPSCKLILRRGNRWSATAFLGPRDERTLITVAIAEKDAPSDGFWLDGLSLMLHRTQQIPQYVVVEPDGRWEANDRPWSRSVRR